jgi:hypothetical protein
MVMILVQVINFIHVHQKHCVVLLLKHSMVLQLILFVVPLLCVIMLI